MLPVRICRLTCVAAALAAGCLIAAMPHRAGAAGDDPQAASDQCSGLAREAGHPPANVLPMALRVLQRSLEPVPATDGLIHLAYAAQMTNTLPTPLDITGVAPVDPLADFSPTGRDHVVDAEGRDITGMVRLFDTSAAGGALPADGPGAESATGGFSMRVPGGNSGLMYFDVTYTDLAQIPRLLSHAITVAVLAGGPGLPARYAATGYTDPVPVGCRPLAVLHPPLVGHGWLNGNGCCTIIDTSGGAHRSNIVPVNGVLQGFEQFAIDYIQIGPNGTCCKGPPPAPNSWWGYGTPILAAAPGVVVEVVDGLPDQQPVGTVSPDLPLANLGGNSVIEDIGGGRYIGYAHFQPGSIPAWVRKGAPLRAGDLIGRLGNSGNSDAPHLHFQVMDRPSFLDATGLPFVFDTQLLEGTITNGDFLSGGPLTIDRTGAGQQRNRMPLETQAFGYNLSR
jgi:hypothetical protein